MPKGTGTRAGPARRNPQVPVGRARSRPGLGASAILDVFTAGDRAAFHVRADGSYLGGLAGLAGQEGRSASRYATGLVTVSGGTVRAVRAVTDRLAAERRLTAE